MLCLHLQVCDSFGLCMIEAWRHWKYRFGCAGERDPLRDILYIAHSYLRAMLACVEVVLCYCYNSTIFAVAVLARVHILLLWHIVLPLLFPVLCYLPICISVLFVDHAIISSMSMFNAIVNTWHLISSSFGYGYNILTAWQTMAMGACPSMTYHVVTSLPRSAFITGGIVTCLLLFVCHSMAHNSACKYNVEAQATPNNHANVFIRLMNGETITKVMTVEALLYWPYLGN